MDWMLMGLLLAATAAMIGMMRTRLTGIYRPTTVVRAELLDWYDAGRGSIACFDAQGGTLRLWLDKELEGARTAAAAPPGSGASAECWNTARDTW